MDFFEAWLKDDARRVTSKSSSFAQRYCFWSRNLFERCINIIEWKKVGDVPPHEIEAPVLLGGMCGVTNKYDGEVTPFPGQYAGAPTKYRDIYDSVSVYSPVYSDILKIGKDAEVIRNNSTRSSIWPTIHNFATLLAHVETSLATTLINGRDNGILPVVSTKAQADAYDKYRVSLAEGSVGTMYAPAMLGMKSIQTGVNVQFNIKDLTETRENILQAFYTEIGVITPQFKKGNMIVEEVNANKTRALFNIRDMLETRKRDSEKVNKLFGSEWEPDISEEIKIMMEENRYDANNDKAASQASETE